MKSNKPAFTLIELLVVIAIIGMLATISVIALSNARSKSRDAKRAGDMKQVQTALELFFNDNNRYPTAEEWATGKIGSAVSGVTSTYMQIIPTAPTPADGNCEDGQNIIGYTPSSDGTSYSISFCLGNTTGSLTPGPKCLTPGGIVDVDCGSEEEAPAWACGDDVTHEGESYPTVEIGTQCWFAKNLNVGTRVDGSGNQGDYSGGIQKYCYSDNEAICTTDGGLYQWHMVVGLPQACDASYTSPCNISGTIQGLCPSGWHVPSFNEFQTLAQNADPGCDFDCDSGDCSCTTAGGKLKASTPTWDGTDNFNFTALSAGFRGSYGSFGGRGGGAYLWSSSPNSGDPGSTWFGYLGLSDPGFSGGSGGRANGFSVRCLQD